MRIGLAVATCLLAAGCEQPHCHRSIDDGSCDGAAANVQTETIKRHPTSLPSHLISTDPARPVGAANASQYRPAAPPKPAGEGVETGPRVVEFAPGLRIDYVQMEVELDCEVILREGELELLVYAKAPTPKEHEAILKTQVQPERIFQALGLIGIRPGHPTLYNVDTREITPPEGDPVDVFVHYERDGEMFEHSICDWVLNHRTGRPMEHSPWLFTGGERDDRGRYAADIEGTVVTVVDFPSAVLSVPASHSSADEQLWAAANTSAIPPVGTKVVVVFRPKKSA